MSDPHGKKDKLRLFPPTRRIRLTPTATLWAAGAQPIGATSFDPRSLFDMDTTASFSLGTQASLDVSLRQAVSFSGVKVFGGADGVLTIRAWDGATFAVVPGLDSVPLSSLGVGWNDLEASAPVTAQRLRIDWVADRHAVRTSFAELDLWGLGDRATVPDASALSTRGSTIALPWSFEPFDGTPQSVELPPPPTDGSAVSPVPVTIDLDRSPADFCRAFLSYETNGWSSWISIRRSINGRSLPEGALSDAQNGWVTQVEEINPSWLRLGANVVAFSTSDRAALSSELRNVRIVGETNDGSCFVDVVADNATGIARQSHTIRDGDLSSSWGALGAGQAPDPSVEYRFDRSVQLEGVAIDVGAHAAGTLGIDCLAAAGWTTAATVELSVDFQPGSSFVPLTVCPTVQGLRLRRADASVATDVREIVPIASPVGARATSPTIRITYPDRGRFTGRDAYIRGFVVPWDDSAPRPTISIGPVQVDSTDGSFEAQVSKDDVGLWAQPDSDAWSLPVQVTYPDGRQLTRVVVLDQYVRGPESSDDRLLPTRKFSVAPGKAQRLSHDDATLELAAGTVAQPVDLAITPLADTDLAGLDAGMTNVTRGPRKGYRFEPHGMRFQKKLRVSLPYNPGTIPADSSDDDVSTFYFDQELGRWVPLERVEVDKRNHRIVSLTDHFTDMINATLALPDHPQPLSYDPTALEKVQPADPAARITLIEPPKGSSTGDARTSYALELPAGRKGLTPALAVTYVSGEGNGGLGVGWSLSSSSVSIDTRWGVPRYDVALETETYNLDGDQLTPVAHRGPLVARVAEKTFHFRIEGRFARIVRHGDTPSNYWWEVTDKRGVTSFYGGDPATRAPDPASTLADDQGRVFRWFLREVRDPHGNGIRYDYARVIDPGVAGGTVPGRQLYVQSINYTTFQGQPGAYTVRFIRDGDLGEPRRPDVSIDARGGFKIVTAQLLRRIEASFNGAMVRSWNLDYVRGAFDKTLLASITQNGADGSALAAHRFSYYDRARQDGAYVGFGEEETWSTGSDGVRSAPVDLLASAFGSDAGKATALSGYETTHAGGHLYVGFNPDAPTKQGSVGGKMGFTGTVSSQGLLALIDLNGDDLPDKVFKNSSGIFVRMNQSGPHGSTVFGPPVRIDTLPAISEESTSTISFGAESYFGVTAIANEALGFTKASVYFSDVNGDGLPDLVDGGTVLFNHPAPSGIPTFNPDSATSPVPVGPAAVDGGILPDYGSQKQQILSTAPLHDTLRRWTAPYPGQVRVTGDVSLAPSPPAGGSGADGVRVAIQHNGTELWSATIDASDASAHSPSGVDAVDVQKGDRIYFRVQSRNDGSHDVVSWDPEIAYVGASATTDVNGLDPWHARASEDFVFAGRPGILVNLPFSGRVRLAGDFQKTGTTTDDVTLFVLKNGSSVFAATLNWDQTGVVPMGIGIDVAQGDTLQLRVKVDSPIDLGKVSWTPNLYYAGPPDGPVPSYTVDGTTVTVSRLTDDSGQPLVQIHPPYDIDFYPTDGLTAPQAPWVAPADGTVTVSSHLTAASDANGVVFITAKQRGALLAKRTILIANGVVANKQVDIDVTGGDEIFFDYSCYDPELAPKIGSRAIKVDGHVVASAFHIGAQQGVFPGAYRGWAVAGYNGNPPRDVQPIVESDLDVAFDANTTVDPRTSKAFLFTPFPEAGVWRGPEDETFVAASTEASSRLGPDSAVTLGASGGAAGQAPARMSSSGQTAGQVGVAFLSGSLSVGSGTSDVDFLDMNGDGFPDVVANGRIQYSPEVGGLEPASRPVGGLGDPRKSDGTAANAGVGGSPANFRVGSRGQVDAPGRGGSSKENDTGTQMVNLGLGGDLGSGSSTIPYDLVDMNGDGLPDRVTVSGGTLNVALNLGYAFATAEAWGPGALNEGASQSTSIGANLGFNGGIYDYAGGASLSRNSSETTATLADINGDGLPDRISRSGDMLRVGINTGQGFLADADWGSAPVGAFAANSDTSIGGGAYFTVGIGPVCVLGCYVIVNPGADTSTSLARQESALLDVDGDGCADHVRSSDDATLTVARNATGQTNLLRSIARPLGATIDLEYARDGNTPDQPSSRWVLSRVSIDDGVHGDGVDRQVATFRYEKGTYDRLEREFYGYGRVTEDIRDASHGDAIYRSTVRDYRTDAFYVHGLLVRERLQDASGRPFFETANTYTLIDVGANAPLADPKSTTATAFPALVRSDRRFFEGQATPGKTTFSTQDFDGFGNVVRQFDAGDAGPQDDVEALVAYGACDTTHIVGVPVTLTVRANGTEQRRREGVLNCATGEITRSVEYLASGQGAETNLDYDEFGNLVHAALPPNRNGQRYEMRYDYDTVVRTYPVQTTDSFGYVSTATWDFSQGLKTSTTDLNGNAMSFTYDTFGRMTSTTGPYEQAGSSPSVVFEYHPEAPVPWSRTRHNDKFRDPSDPIDVVRFVDGFPRDLQTKSDATVFSGATAPAADVMAVSGRIRFDAVGRATDRWHPVVEPLGHPDAFNPTYDTVSPTHTDFDIMDRPKKVTLPDATFTTMRYAFGTDRDGTTQLETRIIDANGAQSLRYQNVRDLITGLKQINRTSGGVQQIWTSYDYDALRRLVAVTDDRNDVTRIAWDNLGRKVAVDSPDEGRTEDAYDLAGNRVVRVTQSLRGEGRQVSYDHEFTRLVRINYPDFPGNDVTYTYGPPGAPFNRAGRVATVVDESGIREHFYGRLGEITSEVRTIASATPNGPEVYRTNYTYDTFGRLQSLVYPDGESLTFGYDSGGRVRLVAGYKGGYTYSYLWRMEYDKFGERAFVQTGNGVRTTYAYRPDNLRLQHVLETKPDGTVFVNLDYVYDPVGNVLSMTNAVAMPHGSDFGGPTQQTFAYDDLRRLMQSSGTYQFAPNKTNRYSVSFDYDTIHNMVSRNQLNEIVQPSSTAVRQQKTTYAYRYSYAGSHPHGATHIGDRTFTYDGNGNQLGWTNDRNGTRRNIVWDEENRIQSLSDNGHQLTYTYDDQGERASKRGPQGETVYVNPWFTIRNGQSGTKHVWVGPTRIASKLMKQDKPGSNPSGNTPLEKDQYFYHPDHLGSTRFVTDAAGNVYEHLEYFPFGETWVDESTNTQRTPYGFTGNELDEETGLYYADARYHDPRIGSFNSGEPLLFTSPEKARDNPMFLSVYAYARQNPLVYADPDGRDVIIAVGQATKDRRLAKGYPAAALQLKKELEKDKNVHVRIVTLPPVGAKTTPEEAIRGAADAIVANGNKVSSLVYIGHGATDGQGLLPRGEDPLSVKKAIDAARLDNGGAFVAYGCHVANNADIDALRNRGIHAYATDRYTYTTSTGLTALGDDKEATQPYVPLKDLELKEVTGVIKAQDAVIGAKDPTVLDYLKKAENDTK